MYNLYRSIFNEKSAQQVVAADPASATDAGYSAQEKSWPAKGQRPDAVQANAKKEAEPNPGNVEPGKVGKDGGMKSNPRKPQVARLPVTFEAKKDHVVAIFHIEQSTIGLRFESPEQMLSFFSQMMEKAAIVWPRNEWIKEYLSDD